jgi:hypothetical protein
MIRSTKTQTKPQPSDRRVALSTVHLAQVRGGEWTWSGNSRPDEPPAP